MIKKILKWTGIAFLGFIVILSVTVATRQHLTYDAPYPNVKSSKDSAVILRGKELVFGPAHCADCHAPGADPKAIANNIDVPLTGDLNLIYRSGISIQETSHQTRKPV